MNGSGHTPPVRGPGNTDPPDNAPAIRLYRRAGFETLAVLKRDTRIADRHYDGLLMRRFVRG